MMEFRPCIDIHNGQVKQIIGGTLQDQGDRAVENFTSLKGAEYYADLYRQHNLKGGHVILLNASDSALFSATKEQAIRALAAYPGGLQVGGGITAANAAEYLDAGASHVIVTSYIFKDGQIKYENIEKMKHTVGKEHLVLDVSCRRRDGRYYVVTDRWQRFTEVPVTVELLQELSSSCDEFLVHAVDVEGRSAGIEEEIVGILGSYVRQADSLTAAGRQKLSNEPAGLNQADVPATPCPITYAGGIAAYEDITRLKTLGHDQIHATIGSALDLFGGPLEFQRVIQYFNH